MGKNSSTQTSQELHKMTHFDIFKKLKRFSPLEPSVGILGSFCAAVLFIGCLFFLNYSTVTKGLHGFSWLRFDAIESPKVGFLDEGGEGCDLFEGNWVWDERYPLYQSRDCLFLDEGFRCSENGRKDSFYTKWRWQPKDCNLPTFDAKLMLEKLRNKRVVFVGDSIGRNQWESLLCMLSSAVPNKTSIYEVGGRPITKHMGFLVFKFEDYNCTIEYYRAPFLVLQSRAPAGVPEQVKMTLKLDQMDWTSNLWKGADVLVFNTGHWWNFEKTVKMGCYFQEQDQVKMDVSVESAFRRSIETVLAWVGSQVNISKTHVFFRTYAPVHFRGGEWNTGGSCLLETLPDLGAVPVLSEFHFGALMDVFSKRMNESHVTKLDLLNVTNMSLQRKDGHPSIYYLGPKEGPAPAYRQDCSHWCLPGIPDSWNEILYALFLKQESLRSQTFMEPSQPPL